MSLKHCLSLFLLLSRKLDESTVIDLSLVQCWAAATISPFTRINFLMSSATTLLLPFGVACRSSSSLIELNTSKKAKIRLGDGKVLFLPLRNIRFRSLENYPLNFRKKRFRPESIFRTVHIGNGLAARYVNQDQCENMMQWMIPLVAAGLEF